ncbi:MAG: DinB family protein [Acidimicrobiales bacterium]
MKAGVLAEEVGEGLRSWRARALDRLEGLDDDEYFWTPVPGCWSVRRADNGRWSADLGPRGNTRTPDGPPPVTTIAWRLWHLGGCPNPAWPPADASSPREFADRWFTRTPQDSADAFGTAAEAIAAFDRHGTAVADSVVGFTDTDLLTAVGPGGGRFGGGSIHGLVLHVADELIHHGAEIGILRDLYRAGMR